MSKAKEFKKALLSGDFDKVDEIVKKHSFTKGAHKVTESIKAKFKFYTNGMAYIVDENDNFLRDAPGVFAPWCKIEPDGEK